MYNYYDTGFLKEQLCGFTFIINENSVKQGAAYQGHAWYKAGTGSSSCVPKPTQTYNRKAL